MKSTVLNWSSFSWFKNQVLKRVNRFKRKSKGK